MCPMFWGLCYGVSELKGPEEGGPHHVEVNLRGSQNGGTGVLR